MPDEQLPDSGTDAEDTVPDDDLVADDSPPDEPETEVKTAAAAPSGPLFSPYGLVSAALGLVSVAALVFGVITWNAHREDSAERSYRTKVLQTAASWTSVLINLNAENVEKGMVRLRDKTVGELSGEFDAAIQPYREVVEKIQSRSTGRIEAVAIETVHHDLDSPGGPSDKQSHFGKRTDPVMVVATSVAENVEGRPQTVHWALQLDVSDVNGQLKISKLRSIR